MKREEFIKQFEVASEELDMNHVYEILTRADDKGLEKFEQRGLENLVIDMEEMAELSQEISKYIRGNGDRYNLIQEMSDVLICVHHLQNLYNITDEELNKGINVKINRCERRLNGEEK